MNCSYMKEGMRTSVDAILLVRELWFLVLHFYFLGTRVLPSNREWTIVPHLFLVDLYSWGCVPFCVSHTSWRCYSICAFSQCLLSSTLMLVLYCILSTLFSIAAEKRNLQFLADWRMIVVFLPISLLYAKLVILQSVSTKIYPNILDSFQC